ncbi:MAG: circadian clock KaiB family protein [Bacteroidales bacterium]
MENQDKNRKSSSQTGRKYLLRLFITGSSPRSIRAVNNLTGICSKYMDGDYELQIVDIYEKPELAGEDQIIAIPTLIRILPAPERRIIGDLSHTEEVMAGLGLEYS